ncbi:MAG TPA: RnfABCDGE type electron transport complex subunit B [Gammaproteobacteria bacterium]|nr:RnfABCDGE type electron transport complex subunit B [Gammaproteobacteria bacterium]
MATVAQIDALLPQTQCTRCGFPDCHTYAEAIARDEVAIDRCPPGGDETLQALSQLLSRPVTGLDPAVGTFTPDTVACIDEALCIGCTKCIGACPVDAIVGGPKLMHTVIEALCTGCELCLPPCPVDCIRLGPAQGVTEGYEGWQFPKGGGERAEKLRERYGRHQVRDRKTRQEKRTRLDARDARAGDLKAQRQAEIAAALARVRAKRGETPR